MTNPKASDLNADPLELAKFGDLAHRWWDLQSDFRPLHEINPLRLDWIDGIASLAGKRVLDVGCGGGILADSMARRGAEVLGIDLATKALRVAQLHAIEAGTPRVAYREVAAEDAGRRNARLVRCRDLHGDAGARARSIVDRVRRVEAADDRTGWIVLLDDQPQPEGLPVRHRRCRASCSTCCPRARTTTRASCARASWRVGAATRGARSVRDARASATTR